MNEDEKAEKIALLTEQMQRAAMELEFETAAKLRDELYRLQGRSDGASDSAPKPGTKTRSKARNSRQSKKGTRKNKKITRILNESRKKRDMAKMKDCITIKRRTGE